MNPLYVVTVVFNPNRYKTRYNLYRDFAKHVADSGAQLLTVEVAFGERPFEVTEAGNRWHLQLKTDSELWLKENALNLGIQRLPDAWKYVAWVDCDLQFGRPDWALETVHQLQHDPVVQMFSTALDMGPTGDPLNTFKGFAYCYRNGIARKKSLAEARYYDYGDYWHPGFCWAATRDAFDGLGGLIDWAIVGSADYHMAQALIGNVESSVPAALDPGYHESAKIWQDRADKCVMGHIGYVDGTIMHRWHGKKRQRAYRDRWQVLIGNAFDPELDLKRDWQGLWQLTDRTPQLKRDLMSYFKQRSEDSIDVA